MMSMTADVIDLDELNTGKRREGIFGAIYWWMVKVGFAIAGLLSGTLMTLVGFDPSVAVQPEGAITGLRIFFSAIPIVGTLIAIYVVQMRSVHNWTNAKLRRTKKHHPLTISGTNCQR
jgi:GPH family glycoside/pentoside/hexuronide:cation symporter